jgi:hypothetical protein
MPSFQRRHAVRKNLTRSDAAILTVAQLKIVVFLTKLYRNKTQPNHSPARIISSLESRNFEKYFFHFFQKKNTCDSMTFLSQELNRLGIENSHIDDTNLGWLIPLTSFSAGVEKFPGERRVQCRLRVESALICSVRFLDLVFSGRTFVRP